MYLTKDHFPNTGLGSLPELDIELSLQVPSQAPIWRSVVSDARLATGFNTKRGRSRELDQFVAGTLDLELDNRDRGFDPEHSASPIFEHIKPERRIRVLAKWDGTQYVVFDGFVDGFEQKYGEKGLDASAVITASDGFKLLAATELPSSFYEMVVAAVSPPPTHWLKLDEATGETAARDTAPLLAPSAAAHGTYQGGATLGATELIAYDGDRTSITLDGTNDYVSVPPVEAVPTAATSTVVMWFSHGAAPTDGAPDYLLHFGNSSASAPTPNSLRCYLLDSSYGASSGMMRAEYRSAGVTTTATSAATYVDSLPHFLAISVNTSTLSIITDAATASAAITAAAFTTPTEFFVGTVSGFQSAAHWLGSVASVAVWDGTVLSATQLSDLYNAGDNALTGEATGTRVRRVLDYAAWPGIGTTSSESRDIDTGSSTVGANDLSGGSALDYLQTLADTEQGQMYMGLDSAMSSDSTFKFVWRQRHAIITASRSSAPGLSPTASQATFSDDGADLRYADVLIDYGEHRLYNEAEVTRQGGAPQRASDTDSQREYLKRTYTKSTLDASDNTAFDHATWAVNRFSDPEYRIIGLVVKPQRDPTNLWPHVLGREIGDRITVQLTPMGVGSEISKAAIIEGVEHSMQDGEWTTTWRLSEADSTAYWVLDDEALSVLDSTTVPAF